MSLTHFSGGLISLVPIVIENERFLFDTLSLCILQAFGIVLTVHVAVVTLNQCSFFTRVESLSGLL